MSPEDEISAKLQQLQRTIAEYESLCAWMREHTGSTILAPITDLNATLHFDANNRPLVKMADATFKLPPDFSSYTMEVHLCLKKR